MGDILALAGTLIVLLLVIAMTSGIGCRTQLPFPVPVMIAGLIIAVDPFSKPQ